VRVLGQCPACGGDLAVRRLQCGRCQTAVEGRFELSRFDRLTPEQLEFLLLFLKSRGNIRDVERELGLSYPTVRNRLDGVLRALGLESEDRSARSDRLKLLEAVERGEISVDEALEQFKPRP
jgi:hypothetical protein